MQVEGACGTKKAERRFMMQKAGISTHQKKKKLEVIVESVVPLNDAQQDKLYHQLKQSFPYHAVQMKLTLNPRLLGGISIKMGEMVLDGSVRGQLRQFQREMESCRLATSEVRKLSDFLSDKITSFQGKPVLTEVGKVLSVSDGIAKIKGLPSLAAGEQVIFASGAVGMALNLNPETVDVVIFENADRIQEGEHVYRAGRMNTVPVGLSLLGRVINPLGKPLDDKPSLNQLEQRPVHMPAPGIVERESVSKPIQTGIKAIDALVPIGCGQRELIIGDRQTGKTTLIVDTIISQRVQNEKSVNLKDKVFCVYVAIGQKQSTVREVMRTLQKYGAMDYTIIVSATASDSAAMQYLAPYAGCSVGEYFRDNGMNVIVFYDDLSKHAVAYREMSLLLKRPSGREAFPGDVFYLHSRLLERAAQLSSEKGGGSLTAIPVVETQEGDVSAYIPTNIISITDGQIFLESGLFHQGIRPAVNVGLSVSRVGSAAQTVAMKKVSASLKLELAQYREVLSFAQLSSDLDATTQALLNRGARLTAVMKQKPYRPLTMAQEVVSLFVGTHGFLDDISIGEIEAFQQGLSDTLRLQGADILTAIETTGDLSDETVQKLTQFIQKYTESYQSKADMIADDKVGRAI